MPSKLYGLQSWNFTVQNKFYTTESLLDSESEVVVNIHLHFVDVFSTASDN